MQEILTNGKFFVNDDAKTFAESVLINDGAVVLASNQKEVLELKNKDTSIIDLNNDYVFPCGFGINANIFKTIDNKLKNPEKDFIIEDDKDENYEKFENYEEYKNEFLVYQKLLIEKGIATISEFDADKKMFVFYKKLSEDNLLKIDVALYVNLITFKNVMDDNCVTYRKYRNHLRLGGYYLKIDGAIQDLKAWLSKSYAGTKSHFGAGEVVGEQLYILVKNALDEKKQIVFEANGDKSVAEILNVFDEIAEKEKIENFYKPIIFGANLVYKKFVQKLKKYDFTLCLNNYDLKTIKTIKKFVGLLRKKYFYNYSMLIKNKIKFVFELNLSNALNFPIQLILKKENKLKRVLNKPQFHQVVCELCDIIYNNPAYMFFDQDTKATIETQKQVNFFASDANIFENFSGDYKIKRVFLNEEKTEY